MTNGGTYHTPVLVEAVVAYLRPERGGLYFDGTVGGGGHSEAIVERSEEARVLGVDRDPAALEAARRRLSRYGDRVRLVAGDYASVAESLTEPLSGGLLDLGVSSHQLDDAARGFTYRAGALLDMRMDPQSGGRTAADLLNEMSETELADVFYRYGEERRSRRLASEIVKRRRRRRFETSDDLMGAITAALGPGVRPGTKARLFQALRLAVNDELSQLERGLGALRDRLNAGGTLVVLSYHSLEDRLVKERFRAWSGACVCPPELPVCVCGRATLGKALTRKPVVPSDDEVEANPRARSAKLRAWRKAEAA